MSGFLHDQKKAAEAASAQVLSTSEAAHGAVKGTADTASTTSERLMDTIRGAVLALGQTLGLSENTYPPELEAALFPVFDVISTAKQDLDTLSKDGNIDSSKLREIQDRLQAVELEKKEGVWLGELSRGVIPKGQAVVNALFEETRELEAKLLAISTEPAAK